MSILSDLLDNLLAASAALLTSPPERQVVEQGDTFAHDCEMLAVHCAAIGFDTVTAPNGSRSCVVVPSFTLVVTLLRCWPTADGDGAPTAAAITAAARSLANDGSALAYGFAECDGLFPSVAAATCDKLTLTPGLRPIAPEGGLAGWRFTFDVSV